MNTSLILTSFQIAVGTKTGEILIYDLASSTLIETIKAHTSTVWSMHVRADEQALVSGSADKDVKFWEFEHKDATGDSVSEHPSLGGPGSSISTPGTKWEATLVGAHPNLENDG